MVQEIRKAPRRIREIEQRNRHYDGGILFRKEPLPEPEPAPEQAKLDCSDAITLLMLGAALAALYIYGIMPLMGAIVGGMIEWVR